MQGDVAPRTVPQHEPECLKDRHQAEHDADRSAGAGAEFSDEVGIRHIVNVGDQHTYRRGKTQPKNQNFYRRLGHFLILGRIMHGGIVSIFPGLISGFPQQLLGNSVGLLCKFLFVHTKHFSLFDHNFPVNNRVIGDVTVSAEQKARHRIGLSTGIRQIVDVEQCDVRSPSGK